MPIVTDGFEQTTFLGASISSFSSNVGWNEESTSVTVILVEDPNNDNKFSPPTNGKTVSFVFDGFRFDGILQSWEYKKSVQGGFYYEVVIKSPTEILSNCELVIGGYNGSVGSVANLFNVYGMLENSSFGFSRVNEAGMPWPSLQAGIIALTNGGPGTLYGAGKILFRNETYVINLDALPVAPDYYRIAGNNVNLLEVISKLCQDTGFDYICCLEKKEPHNLIYFKTVSRRLQPNLTALRDFINSRDDASAKSRGMELRNETTSAFVVGGQEEKLYKTELDDDLGSPASNNIWPYWGLDKNGNCIIGSGLNDRHKFSIDARQVNCLGVGETYDCTVGELRSAMHSIDSWESYVTAVFPDKAQQIGMVNFFSASGVLQELFNNGGIPLQVVPLNQQAAEQYWNEEVQNGLHNLYTFVKTVADEYYGSKFMVRIPFATFRLEPDTDRLVGSYEPSDAGYLDRADWLLGNNPLDLPNIYKDIFTQEDGRWMAMVKFPNANSYELKDFSPDAGVIVDNSLYLKCQLEPYIVFTDAENALNPRVVLTLPGPVNTKTQPDELDEQGQLLLAVMYAANGQDAQDLQAATSGDVQKINKLLGKDDGATGGAFPYAMGPFANIPLETCVPLRSNISTYGPWASVGPYGKVRFEQQPELVPWNFNGYTYLDFAGSAQVSDVIAAQQIGEMGTVDLVGSPIVQLGDALVDGGPNVTGIDCEAETNGVTTTYRMRTYTPTFGDFAKYNSDKFQRLARTAQSNERKAIANYRSSLNRPQSFFANRERALITTSGPKGRKTESPHNLVVANYIETVISGVPVGTNAVSFCTNYEGMRAVRSSAYNKIAVSSLDHIFRPYSYEYQNYYIAQTGSMLLGHYEKPPVSGIITSESYNPFNFGITDPSGGKYGDASVYAFGSTYPQQGLYSGYNPNETNVRAVSLAGPITVTGWGYDLFGKAIPANNYSGNLPVVGSTTFKPFFRTTPNQWRSGPVNLRWNDILKMWDSAYKLWVGKYNGNNEVMLYKASNGLTMNITIPVTPFIDLSTIPSGTKMIGGFIDDVAVPISTECV